MGVERVCPECGGELPADAPEGLCPSCLLHSGLASAWMLSPRQSNVSPPGPFVAPEPAELTRHFPQLQILSLLGQGGMGAVYQARQTKLDRLVALKVLPPNLVQDPAFAERFTREARALARLSHPNIVSVHDFGESSGLFYFIMEYVDGASLRQVLLEGRLSPAECLKIVPQLCDALQYAHDEGVVHRDIKPENILLDRRGRVKIADFGLAKLVGVAPANYTLTGSRQVMGTPHYMAPEQMEKPQTVDHRADIYSLGVVLYEMLTGELPLGRFAPPSHKSPVDARLDEVVLRALAKEPAERFQKVSDLKAGVEHTNGALALAEPIRVPQRHLGVRFTAPYVWCSQALGLVRLEGNQLVFEYLVDYAGVYKTSVKERQVLLTDLVQFDLEAGWWDATLVVAASRLSALDGIPGGTLGQARLGIQAKDRKAAEELVQAVQTRLALRGAGAGALSAREPDDVQLRMAIPAAGLVIAAVIAPLFWAIMCIVALAEEGPRFFGGPAGFIFILLFAGSTVVGLSAVMAAGSFHMRRAQRYGLVVLAAIVAMIPWSPHALIGFPTGIWILLELRRQEVKDAFRWGTRKALRPLPPAAAPKKAPPPPPEPTGFVRRRARSIVRGFRTLFFDSYASPPNEQPEPDPRHVPTSLHTPPPVSEMAAPVARFADSPPPWQPPRDGSRFRRVFKFFALMAILTFAFSSAVAWFSSRRPSAHWMTPATIAPPSVVAGKPDDAIRTFLQGLDLGPSNLRNATKALREANAEVRKLEEEHADLKFDDRGHLRVIIGPLSRDVSKIRNNLWSRLDKEMDVQRQGMARQREYLLRPVVPDGDARLEISIGKTGDWYDWKVVRYAPNYGPMSESNQGPKLPEQLQRYWDLGNRHKTRVDDAGQTGKGRKTSEGTPPDDG